MKIRKELVKREIAGDTVLVPVGKSILEDNGLYALNPIASFIWDILEEAENEEDIVKAILDKYDIDEATASSDTHEFINKLKELKILE